MSEVTRPKPRGTRYWLCFDIALTAQYEKLFAWLDEHDAEECGDNFTTFLHEKPYPRLVQELKKLFTHNSRAYLIGPLDSAKGRWIGRFIAGRRKAPPWTGFGAIPSLNETDEG
jgi:hypothetical protein